MQKQFKRVKVYLQGLDLLDNEITTEYYSEDGNYAWIELSRLNRRRIVLGMQWNFGR